MNSRANRLLSASALLIVLSIAIEAFSKFAFVSAFRELAGQPDSEPSYVAVPIRQMEGYIWGAVAAAIAGTFLAVAGLRQTNPRSAPLWFRVPALLGVLVWALLAMLYFLGPPYTVVASGYLACILWLIFGSRRGANAATQQDKTQQAEAQNPSTDVPE